MTSDKFSEPAQGSLIEANPLAGEEIDHDTAARPGRRVRVMYVVPDLGVGGAERHATTLMPNLDPSRFATATVCIGAEGALFGDLAGSNTRAVALHRGKRQALPALADLIREMRIFAPDVVLTRGYNAEVLGRTAARLTGVRHSVVWVHSCSFIEPMTRVHRVADRVLDKVTDSYFGVAHAQIDHLVNDLGYPANKIRIIYNGVDTDRYQSADDRSAISDLGIGKSDKVVGIVAQLTPVKDHATFLRAAASVVERVPVAKFLIVGDGPSRPGIEKLASELCPAGSVVLTGSRSDVPDLLRGMDAFVLSSTSECFPIALLEAMASGRPAVCTAVGGVPEIVDEPTTGYLVQPQDPDALADRLVGVLTDPGLSKRMGQSARARVDELFSLEASVRETEQALLEMAGDRSGMDRPIRLTVVFDLIAVGGAEMVILNLFKQLDPRVVVPKVVCLREAGPLAQDFEAAGFEVEVLHRSGRFDIHTLPRLVRSLRADRADAILVAHHHRASLALGPIAASLAGVRVKLVAAHDMDLTSVGGRVLPRWAVNTLGMSDALVLLSAAQGDYLHRAEGVGQRLISTTREAVIPNGIDVGDLPSAGDRLRVRNSLGLGETEFVVGIVARLSAQKAHDVLFRAIAKCAASLPQIRLMVIGTGEREAELQKLARDLQIDTRTTFLGLRRDVPDLLSSLDVACLSSVHEGMPMTLIEAMAAGLPVVATDCGSVRDLITDGVNGFVVPVGDDSGFADRLLQLAGDESLRLELGKSGRARVEREFRVQQMARAYEELLTDLVVGKQ